MNVVEYTDEPFIQTREAQLNHIDIMYSGSWQWAGNSADKKAVDGKADLMETRRGNLET